jgi:hypothetical protein
VKEDHNVSPTETTPLPAISLQDVVRVLQEYKRGRRELHNDPLDAYMRALREMRLKSSQTRSARCKRF